MISVICPIYNEEKYISKCIDSLLLQDYPKDDIEILFIDGMSYDKTRDIVSSYMHQYQFIKMIDNPNRIVPCALNIGIKEAAGEIIIRIDAHAMYPSNYFSTLINGLKRLNADNVGVACQTDVINKTKKTLAIREVLCNKYGVGNSLFRTGIKDEMLVETVPFGCWPKETFKKFGLFDEKLIRNQDIEFNKRIIRGGGNIYILPETYCTYYARETWRGLARNNYGNGKWNILTVYFTKTFSSLSLRHFIPLMFLLSLLVPLLVSLIWHPALFITCASFISYFSLVSIISAKLSLSKKLNYLYLLISFFILHLSYGYGSLIGIISLIFRKQQ